MKNELWGTDIILHKFTQGDLKTYIMQLFNIIILKTLKLYHGFKSYKNTL